VGQRNGVSDKGPDSHRKGHFFGGDGLRKVTYGENVALWCGYSVLAAE